MARCDSAILAGAEIGEGAIIVAGSIVTKSLLAYFIVTCSRKGCQAMTVNSLGDQILGVESDWQIIKRAIQTVAKWSAAFASGASSLNTSEYKIFLTDIYLY